MTYIRYISLLLSIAFILYLIFRYGFSKYYKIMLATFEKYDTSPNRTITIHNEFEIIRERAKKELSIEQYFLWTLNTLDGLTYIIPEDVDVLNKLDEFNKDIQNRKYIKPMVYRCTFCRQLIPEKKVI